MGLSHYSQNPYGGTPFNLTYGTEAVIPIELKFPSIRVESYEEGSNSDRLRSNLDLIDEVRERATVRMAVYKRRVARYHDAKVKVKYFKIDDLVLRRAKVSQPANQKKLSPN